MLTDLRSDTVTKQPQAMLEAMINAEVGDDVYRDDPTVNRFEGLAAQILGKEAALLVTSGTMGNLLGVMSQTHPGDEIILGRDSHIFIDEVAGPAMLGGLSSYTLVFENEIPNPAMIKAAVRPCDDIHQPLTRLICLENALSNGRVVKAAIMKDVYEIAKEHALNIHLDGARIFNAAVALDVDVKELTQYCDTVNCCISKGLCAPIGSVLAGSQEVIERARKLRKMLGGGTRQSGYLAAAGIFAMEHMVKRLPEDHANAKYLAEKLAVIKGIEIIEKVETNMVFLKVCIPMYELEKWQEQLKNRGVLISNIRTGGVLRFLTHYGIGKEEIDHAVAEIKTLMSSISLTCNL